LKLDFPSNKKTCFLKPATGWLFFVPFSKQAGIRKGVGFHHPETFSSTSFFTMLKKLTEHNLKEKKRTPLQQENNKHRNTNSPSFFWNGSHSITNPNNALS